MRTVILPHHINVG